MLQTFPRSYKFVKAGAPVRFSKLGRLIGNAVPVRLGEMVGRALVDHVAASKS
jgi:DNA (cytosine-5)-methyltransferase 1